MALLSVRPKPGIGRKQSAARADSSAKRHKPMGMRITADRIAMMHGNWLGVTINDLVSADGNALGTEVIIKISVNYD